MSVATWIVKAGGGPVELCLRVGGQKMASLGAARERLGDAAWIQPIIEFQFYSGDVCSAPLDFIKGASADAIFRVGVAGTSASKNVSVPISCCVKQNGAIVRAVSGRNTLNGPMPYGWTKLFDAMFPNRSFAPVLIGVVS